MLDTLRFLTAGESNKGRYDYVNFGTGWHKLVVGLVRSKDLDDHAHNIQLVGMNEKVDVKEGTEFITAYIPIEVFDETKESIGPHSTVEARSTEPIDLSELVLTYRKSIAEDLTAFRSCGNSKVNYATGVLKCLSALKKRDSSNIALHIAAMHKALTEIGIENGWQVERS